MFCASGLEGPFGISCKVKKEEFVTLTETDGVIPAPYLARYHWISIQQADRFSPEEWAYYLRQSYHLVRDRLPKKLTRKWKD